MLALGLDEEDLLAPEVLHPVGDRAGVSAAHHRRAGDRVRAGRLGDVGLDPHHRAGAVGDGWNALVEVSALAAAVTVAVTGWTAHARLPARECSRATRGPLSCPVTDRRTGRLSRLHGPVTWTAQTGSEHDGNDRKEREVEYMGRDGVPSTKNCPPAAFVG